MQKGESGIKAGIGFQVNEIPNSNLGFVYVGFGSDGKANVGLQLGKGYDFTFLAPFMNLFLVNGLRDNKPISLGIILKYESLRYNNFTINSYSYGGFLNIGNSSAKKSGVLPFVTILRSSTKYINLSTIGGGVTIYNKKRSISTIDIGYYKTDDTYSLVISIGSTTIR